MGGSSHIDRLLIEIDGARYSGSGTILRYAVALSALMGKTLRMINIRARRGKPGLRPQHLRSVLACNELVEGKVEGAEVGSQEILFKPGNSIKGGHYEWEIGTAGSSTMLAMTVLPLLIYADRPSGLRISGGLFQDHAPSAFHLAHVLFPALKTAGIDATLEIIKPGYLPKGGGVIEVTVKPLRHPIQPVRLTNQGKVVEIQGTALSSQLRRQQVSERMAETCRRILQQREYPTHIDIVNDESAVQKGAAMAVWARTDTGCLIGSDMAGKVGRGSEAIGRHVARALIEDIEQGATVDRFLADQLIIYAALANGVSEYLIPSLTDHVESNLWLVQEIIGAKTEIEDKRIRIEGVGYQGNW